MAQESNNVVDEVQLNLAITKWNKSTAILNKKIDDLTKEERPAYLELYNYWDAKKPFNKDYCQSKIDILKTFVKLHKADKELTVALQTFRDACKQIYTTSDGYLKAFREKISENRSGATNPTPEPVRHSESNQQPTPLSRDEMVSNWRKYTKAIKQNYDNLNIKEQSLFEILSDYWNNNNQYDPDFCIEQIRELYSLIQNRECELTTKGLVFGFLKLCIVFYTESEDEFRVFQNTIRPHNRQRSTTQSSVTNRAVGQPIITNRSNTNNNQPQQRIQAVNRNNATTTTHAVEQRAEPIKQYDEQKGKSNKKVWWIIVIIIITLTFVLKPFISKLILNTEQAAQEQVENVISTTTYRSISKSGLNIRAAANTKAKVVGSLKYNQEIEVIKEVNGFAEIKYGDGIGYVSTKYIEKKQNTSTSKTEKNVATTTQSSSPTKQDTKTQTNSKTTTAENASTTAKSTTQTSTQTQNTASKTAEDYYKEGVALAKKFKESEAATSLKKAIDLGSVDAMYYLGMMYVNNDNAKNGFILVLQAANAGHKEAVFQVAELYSAGTGTIKDKAQAKIWYQKAEALGDSRATSRLRKL